MARIAEVLDGFFDGGLPIRLTAYDGSEAGDTACPYTMEVATPRGLAYLLTAPGDLGLARAYVSGDLVLHGTHPGDPYPLLSRIVGHTDIARPGPVEVVRLMAELGVSHFVPPKPPPEEHLPAWRHKLEGLRWFLRHSEERDADAIHHHYDVSNRFYEMVLGPSMTYTCALFPKPVATLEEAQDAKYDLICRKLDLRPGQRLLDLGCGWGGMVRFAAREYGVRALGVTLSREQASWAQRAIKEQQLDHLAEVRHMDYRHVEETGFDAISSIGLTEHIGVANYPAYFGFVHDRLKPDGRFLNHCITRADSRHGAKAGAFIDRYVFPDGELATSGTIVAALEDAFLEVQHHENIRRHYALTLAGWNRNLVENWDEAVAEVGLGTARVWGLYMAGSRIGFERNEIQLHHVLATKTVDGQTTYPMRHAFGA
ncbi:SAM-dependent methyltransferase [Nocardioides jiangxiensis]|uniref:Cyclopropane-fatty-acyl-phospholipid synthase family protein n=1 Tax=Nocardioides jiangxiensis TaxID=3064524 RepID=A0ABT9AXJ8_9ACTN|nr:cyclopropane-fatty-acyl-phospholipid synthase family protein [Nocardioides sp. WY-20]MDO7867174.1 cyclopropane-fatty-acyl-phospholipid synthase family protein [Nocardioides sp. WY-20]